jgi:hypothetical protein
MWFLLVSGDLAVAGLRRDLLCWEVDLLDLRLGEEDTGELLRPLSTHFSMSCATPSCHSSVTPSSSRISVPC